MRNPLIAMMALSLAAPLGAQTDAPPPAKTDMASKLINVPGTNWTVYGPGQTSKLIDGAGPQGYPAMHVIVSQKGQNPWDAGALSPIAKPIAAGDTILVAVYLRAPEAKDGETVPLPSVGAIGSAAPYTTIVTAPVAVTNQWKLYFASGKAPQAFPAGTAQATVHLAGDRHVIELGPIRVFDMGPDFDPARLPQNH
jgi:hypothetical protein